MPSEEQCTPSKHNDSSICAFESNNNYTMWQHIVCWYKTQHPTVSSIICVIGVLANVAIIAVLLQRNMQRGLINCMLVLIAIFDLTLMTANFVYLNVAGIEQYVAAECSMTGSLYYGIYLLFYANFTCVSLRFLRIIRSFFFLE